MQLPLLRGTISIRIPLMKKTFESKIIVKKQKGQEKTKIVKSRVNMYGEEEMGRVKFEETISKTNFHTERG